MYSKAGHHHGFGPQNLRSYLIVKLKTGWEYDVTRRVFRQVKGRKIVRIKGLPNGSRILFAAPDLAKKSAETLSKEERDLTRYMHIIFPKGEDVSSYTSQLKKWECVKEVQVPPDISLP